MPSLRCILQLYNLDFTIVLVYYFNRYWSVFYLWISLLYLTKGLLILNLLITQGLNKFYVQVGWQDSSEFNWIHPVFFNQWRNSPFSFFVWKLLVVLIMYANFLILFSFSLTYTRLIKFCNPIGLLNYNAHTSS